MSKNCIMVIDEGSAVSRRTAQAFEKLCAAEHPDCTVVFSNKAQDIQNASHIVLSAQGSFVSCMKALDGLTEMLQQNVVGQGKPFLGINTGMLALAARGLEGGVQAGLNWIEGQAVPLQPGDPSLPVPHNGKAALVLPLSGSQDNLPLPVRSIKNAGGVSGHYSFLHSFMFECKYNHHILAMADYAGLFPAIVGRDNIIGVQFHPEESGPAGRQLMADFLRWQP